MGIADRRIRGGGIGEALAAMLEPDGQFIRQLDSLGEGLAGSRGVLGMPVVGPWLTQKCCHAVHDGFVAPLAHDPAAVLLDLVADPDPAAWPHAAGHAVAGLSGAPAAAR